MRAFTFNVAVDSIDSLCVMSIFYRCMPRRTSSCHVCDQIEGRRRKHSQRYIFLLSDIVGCFLECLDIITRQQVLVSQLLHCWQRSLAHRPRQLLFPFLPCSVGSHRSLSRLQAVLLVEEVHFKPCQPLRMLRQTQQQIRRP